MHIQISLGTKFRLNLTLSNFWIKLTQEGYFRTNKKKNENYHRLLHIQINLDSKFQLQQTVFIFETKFQRKSILLVENRKKLNIIIE